MRELINQWYKEYPEIKNPDEYFVLEDLGDRIWFQGLAESFKLSSHLRTTIHDYDQNDMPSFLDEESYHSGGSENNMNAEEYPNNDEISLQNIEENKKI